MIPKELRLILKILFYLCLQHSNVKQGYGCALDPVFTWKFITKVYSQQMFYLFICFLLSDILIFKEYERIMLEIEIPTFYAKDK